MIQRLLDKEFEEHMKYQKGSHEEKETTNRRNGKGSFVSIEALEKVLYLRIKELSKKWNRSTKSNWGLILNELLELFGERVEKYIEI